MSYRVKGIVAVLLTIVLALAVSFPAVSATRAYTSPCNCCADSAADNGCPTVSVCAPASADNAIDETSSTPLGAWRAGIVQAAYLPPVARAWAMAPASRSLDLPSYLSLHRFLL